MHFAGETPDTPILRKILEALGKREPPRPGPEELLRDPLGILVDHRHLVDLIKTYAARAKAMEPLALVRIDLDKFKPINDTHGHAAGDTILGAVFVAIVHAVNGQGLAIRAGGDEIVVLLPNLSTPEARAKAERLRAAIGAAKITRGGEAVGVTASIGFALSPPAPADRLDEEADGYARAAKVAGGDRVEGPADG
jgi:diguanylate cyclase (GGDEF)-like protein